MKCHTFSEINGCYKCKKCGIDSKTAEIEILQKYSTGISYAYEKDSVVGGFADKLCNARFLNEWKSNMGDTRQLVKWSFNGHKYSGIYYKSGSDIIRWRKLV